LDNVKEIVEDSKYDLVIRLHPSETKIKYNKILEQLGIDYQYDSAQEIFKSIGKAKWVVGCDTYAMYVATEADKQVYCSIPPNGPNPYLPVPQLKKLKDLVL